MYFKTNEKIYRFENGLHQGSSLSPPLFDIYLEMFFEELTLVTGFIWNREYADDVVIELDP